MADGILHPFNFPICPLRTPPYHNGKEMDHYTSLFEQWRQPPIKLRPEAYNVGGRQFSLEIFIVPEFLGGANTVRLGVMDIITVANVSGFIAVAIVLSRLLIPNLLTVILANDLGDNNSAATWSAAARVIHKSYWPTILQTDVASNRGVRTRARIVGWTVTIGSLLIAIAGIVTPLGLYEDYAVTGVKSLSFAYAEDSGPFGYARLPRSDLGFARRCGFAGWIPCPGDPTDYSNVQYDANGRPTNLPHGWDGRIPEKRYNDLQSGVNKDSPTISSIWDIEWRGYNLWKETTQKPPFMNGTSYIVGEVSTYQSLLLNGGVHLIDGLIVDSDSGAVGLRNHTVPEATGQETLSWQEDILFVQPESVCIPNNLSIEFTIAQADTTVRLSDAHLVDGGGFADLNLNPKLRFNSTDSQNNLDLDRRARIAANLNNRFLALYYNLTDVNVTIAPRSRIGDTYSIGLNNITQTNSALFYDRVHTNSQFSDFLTLNNYTNLSSVASNPFNITDDDFSQVSSFCAWFEGRNPGNISTVAVSCDMAYGIAQPVGSNDSNGLRLLHSAGSRWRVPLYSCATASKAIIKTVSFTMNGTSLADTAVISLSDKVYSDNASMPIWGVEKTDIALINAAPLWGLVDPNSSLQNISTIQREYLWLPGYVDKNSGFTYSSQNLPGVDFLYVAANIMTKVAGESALANGLSTAANRQMDYSGAQSVALYQLWQKLSNTADGMATIHKRIWGDVVANIVVGTKGLAGARPARQLNLAKRDFAVQVASSAFPLVTIAQVRVSYHWPFAIPAFLVAALLALTILATLISSFKNRGPYHALKSAIEHVSPGRIMTTALYPGQVAPGSSAKAWYSQVGHSNVLYEGGRIVPGHDGAQQHQWQNQQQSSWGGIKSAFDTSYTPVHQGQ